jgi:hypothetical protein
LPVASYFAPQPAQLERVQLVHESLPANELEAPTKEPERPTNVDIRRRVRRDPQAEHFGFPDARRRGKSSSNLESHAPHSYS